MPSRNLKKTITMKHLFTALSLCLLLAACDMAPSGDQNVETALTLYDLEEYDAAKEELKIAAGRSLTIYEKADVYNMLGNIADDQEELDSALYYYDLSLAEDAEQVTAWVNKGIIFRLKEEYDSAEACYLEAEARDPNDPELLASMGALFLFRDNIEQSLAYLERSIEMDPSLSIAHRNYAIALAMDGRFEEADASLKMAVRKGYKNGEVTQDHINELRALYEE